MRNLFITKEIPMTSQFAIAVFVASLLTLGGVGTAVGQSQGAAGAADHHPEASAAGASPVSSDNMVSDGAGPMGGVGGMTMSPEMMQMMAPQMMQMMMRMMNSGEMPGMAGRGMPGMMNGNATPMRGMTGDCGESGMAGAGHRMDGMLYGTPEEDKVEMTPERVREFVQRRLAWHGNPRLKLGEIASAPDGRITAEIVTVDGSLVQKLAFNRYPGLFRVVNE